MKKYRLVALGGTFDLIHSGHLELLRKGFEVSSRVIIGLTGDEFAQKKGKHPENNYGKRHENLRDAIAKNFGSVEYEISKLENDFGPAVFEREVEALVVSEETSSQGAELNRLRRQQGSPSVDVIVVPMVLARDGNRISTSRIRRSEIDPSGNIPAVDK